MVKIYGLAYKEKNREGKAIKKEKKIQWSRIEPLEASQGEVIGLGK